MKIFEVVIWRSNPQLANGGYEKTIIEQGKTAQAVQKRFEKQFASSAYGSKSIVKITEIK